MDLKNGGHRGGGLGHPALTNPMFLKSCTFQQKWLKWSFVGQTLTHNTPGVKLTNVGICTRVSCLPIRADCTKRQMQACSHTGGKTWFPCAVHKRSFGVNKKWKVCVQKDRFWKAIGTNSTIERLYLPSWALRSEDGGLYGSNGTQHWWQCCNRKRDSWERESWWINLDRGGTLRRQCCKDNLWSPAANVHFTRQ